MAGITTSGLGSGIDIRSLVDQLVAAERAPTQNRLNRQQQSVQSQLSAYGSLKSALSTFRDQAKALQSSNNFGLMKTSSSNTDALAVSATSKAKAASYQVEVKELAQAQSIAAPALPGGSAFGGGNLTFRFGTVTAENGNVTGFNQNAERATQTVAIAPGSTLSQIRDAVNDAGIGVQASIINDGSGDRLVFTSEKSGAANGFLVDTDGDPALSQLAFNDTNPSAELTRAGQDARLTINGVAISRSENTVDDAIEGVTLTLKEVTKSSSRIDISRDKEAVAGKIKGFVEAYNKLQQQITQLTRYDAENQRASVLTGNSLVRTLNNNLRNLVTSPLGVLQGSEISGLTSLGIVTKSDGTLEVNSNKLDKAIDSNFDQISALFTASGLTGGANGVEFLGSGRATQAGSYAVEITQVATQGRHIGGALPGWPLTIDGSNNGFRIKINGVSSGDIKLTERTYNNGAELAAELQARINGDSKLRDAAATVSVSYNEAEQRLEIVSGRYGSESTVEILSASGGFTAALGLAVGEGTAGLDVAGTIGGQPATGSGQILTGSGKAEGMRLQITGSATGSRGSLTFSRGMLDEVDALLTAYLDSDGILSSTTKGLDDQLKEIGKRQEVLNVRMESVHQRLLAQFIAMDGLLAQMNQTSSFLSQQLAGLNKTLG